MNASRQPLLPLLLLLLLLLLLSLLWVLDSSASYHTLLVLYDTVDTDDTLLEAGCGEVQVGSNAKTFPTLVSCTYANCQQANNTNNRNSTYHIDMYDVLLYDTRLHAQSF